MNVERRDPDDGPEQPPRNRAGGRRKPSLVALLRKASEQFAMLTKQEVESVSSVVPTAEGWELQAEVVELARIPETTSIMASYSLDLDADGELVGYRRTRRYSRSQLDS